MISTRMSARTQVRGRLVELEKSLMIMFENSGTQPTSDCPAPPPRIEPDSTSPKLMMLAKHSDRTIPTRLSGRMTLRNDRPARGAEIARRLDQIAIDVLHGNEQDDDDDRRHIVQQADARGDLGIQHA